MIRVLQTAYPFDRIKCGNGECFVCDSQGRGNCKKENITYEIVCMREGCKHKYIGESSRNAKTRGHEHLTALNNRDEDSVILRHLNEVHNGDVTNNINKDFKMNVTGQYRSALERQIAESVKIELEHCDLINNKSEYRSNNMIRAVFTSGTKNYHRKKT